MPGLYELTMVYPGGRTEQILSDRQTMAAWLRVTAEELENHTRVVPDLPTADDPRRGFIPLWRAAP